MENVVVVAILVLLGLFVLCALAFFLFLGYSATPAGKRRRAAARATRRRELDGLGLVEGADFDVSAFRAAPLPLAEEGRRAAKGGFASRGGGGGFGSISRTAWRGFDVTVLEYSVVRRHVTTATTSGAPETHEARTPYSCAIVEVDAELPPLAIEREGLLGRAAGALGMRDWEIGNPALDGAFEIEVEDEAFAREVVDRRLLERLRARERRDARGVQVGGRFVVAYAAVPLRHARVEPLLDSVVDVRERITRAVLDRYPRAA